MSTALTHARSPFLTARWEHLILANYAVDAALLEPLIPPGLELDLLEGKPYVSLVAFNFLDTRVLRVPWPGYRDFPEVNLRFYVRDGSRRGVAFIREYVPKRLIAYIARGLYNEPYRYAPIEGEVHQHEAQLEVRYALTCQGQRSEVSVIAAARAELPPENSEAHFFKEHSWGYGTSRSGRLVTYEVQHPVWETYPVKKFNLRWDWTGIYGPEWAPLADAEPRSVFLAKGSEVSVSPKLD